MVRGLGAGLVRRGAPELVARLHSEELLERLWPHLMWHVETRKKEL